MVVHFFLLFFCKSMQGWIVVTQKSFQVVGGGHCERAEKSSVAIKRIMDDLFNNDIPLPWCKKHEMLKVSLYTPLKYELRGKVKEDGEYLPKDNEYTVGYTVRMWTTNQGGIPIIQDRYVILRTQKAEKGETEWCVAMM